jgi:hypothetical protein
MKKIGTFKVKGFNSKKAVEIFAVSVNGKVKINKNYVSMGKYLIDYAFKKL